MELLETHTHTHTNQSHHSNSVTRVRMDTLIEIINNGAHWKSKIRHIIERMKRIYLLLFTIYVYVCLWLTWAEWNEINELFETTSTGGWSLMNGNTPLMHTHTMNRQKFLIWISTFPHSRLWFIRFLFSILRNEQTNEWIMSTNGMWWRWWTLNNSDKNVENSADIRRGNVSHKKNPIFFCILITFRFNVH